MCFILYVCEAFLSGVRGVRNPLISVSLMTLQSWVGYGVQEAWYYGGRAVRGRASMGLARTGLIRGRLCAGDNLWPGLISGVRDRVVRLLVGDRWSFTVIANTKLILNLKAKQSSNILGPSAFSNQT